MSVYSYTSIPADCRGPKLGLIVLKADETIETEIHRWLPAPDYSVYVSRIPSGDAVTEETLAAMSDHITRSAALFPAGLNFDAVAYCCTSGASVIGPDRVAQLVRAGCDAGHVTDPVTALARACKRRNIGRLALLSPYIESVSDRLRTALGERGIETPVFGTFNEAIEANVVWIDPQSIRRAATDLVSRGGVDGLFLSCTNLKTFGLLEDLEAVTGLPVMSSNSVLVEHLEELAGS